MTLESCESDSIAGLTCAIGMSYLLREICLRFRQFTLPGIGAWPIIYWPSAYSGRVGRI